MEFSIPEIGPSDILSIILVIGLMVVIYQYLGTFGGYRVSKPFAWEEAVNNGRLSKDLITIEKNFKDKVRFYNLWFQVERIKKYKISGSFAELGVYQGETARAIHLMDLERTFYLFDTFGGFDPGDLEHESQNDSRFRPQMFADTNLEQTQAYINGNANIKFRPGHFPTTATGLENEKFAMVNIDADLYAPTIEALRFFYPRLEKGGVIIIHDYNHNWAGVQKAVIEFSQIIPESIVELPDWQGTAMIIKNMGRS